MSEKKKDEAVLLVDDKEYYGWKDIEITRSIEAAAGSFSLSLVEKWAGQAGLWPLFCGQKIEILVGDDTVITGYIDDIEPSYNETSHTLTIKGRDKTADLIDCAAMSKPGQWLKKKIEQIAGDICKPFDITVKTNCDTGGPVDFSLQPGETAFEALVRLTKSRAILVTSTPMGELSLTRSEQNAIGAKLVEGENIKSASAGFSFRERFKTYYVLAQGSGGGKQNATVNGSAEDEFVKRYRPVAVMAESAMDRASANNRAQWEAVLRAGRSASVQCDIVGWRTDDGMLWQPNYTVFIDSPTLKLKGDMLITQVSLRKGDGGTTANLTLKRPDAFDSYWSKTVYKVKETTPISTDVSRKDKKK